MQVRGKWMQINGVARPVKPKAPAHYDEVEDMRGGTDSPQTSSPEMHETVVHVEFGLSWTKIRNALLGAGSIVAGLIAGGYLFLPARDSDVQQLTRQVTQLMQTVEKINGTMQQLTQTVEQLNQRPPLQLIPPAAARPRSR